MATPLPLPDKIERNSFKTSKFSTSSANMGDSYRQAAPKGLNNKRVLWSIKWVGLTLAEKNTIETLLNSVGEWALLSWTPCYEVTELYFTLEENSGYETRHLGGNNDFSVSCKLKQQFDINP